MVIIGSMRLGLSRQVEVSAVEVHLTIRFSQGRMILDQQEVVCLVEAEERIHLSICEGRVRGSLGEDSQRLKGRGMTHIGRSQVRHTRTSCRGGIHPMAVSKRCRVISRGHNQVVGKIVTTR